jgi:hypothetical protein
VDPNHSHAGWCLRFAPAWEWGCMGQLCKAASNMLQQQAELPLSLRTQERGSAASGAARISVCGAQ